MYRIEYAGAAPRNPRLALLLWVLLLVCILLLVPTAAAAEPSSEDLPATTFAELVERSVLEPGKEILVTFRPLRDSGYRRVVAKVVSLDAATLRVELGEDFADLTTDLDTEFVDPGTSLPFAEPSYVVVVIPERRVQRIAAVDGIGNGVLIGAAAGTGTAFLMGGFWVCAQEHSSNDQAAVCAGYLAAGAAIGAGIGALSDGGRKGEGDVLFDVPAPAELTWTVAPTISRETQGVVFVIRW